MVTTKGMFGVFARVKKISWSIKKKKRKIVLELPYPQSEFPISKFSSRFQLSDGENAWWKMISFV